jgi:hypothetical protein
VGLSSLYIADGLASFMPAACVQRLLLLLKSCSTHTHPEGAPKQIRAMISTEVTGTLPAVSSVLHYVVLMCLPHCILRCPAAGMASVPAESVNVRVQRAKADPTLSLGHANRCAHSTHSNCHFLPELITWRRTRWAARARPSGASQLCSSTLASHCISCESAAAL